MYNPKTAGFGLAPLATLCLAATAHAQTVFTDRTTFNSKSTSLTTLTFDGLSGGANQSTFSSTGLTIGGVNFVGYSNGYGYETYVLQPSYGGGSFSLNGTASLLGGRRYLSTTLPGGVTAFGMDIGQSNGGGSVSASLTISLVNGQHYAQALNFTPGSSQFIGFTASSNISSFLIERPTETGLPPYPDVVDNFSFGSRLSDPVPVSPAPEPSALPQSRLRS